MQYVIEEAKFDELDEILEVFKEAKEIMRSIGNTKQWIDGYPARELLEDDINKHQLFVLKNNDKIQGVFVFNIGEDPTYKIIDNGRWLSDEVYGTIHRVAGRIEAKGVFKAILEYCESKINHLRIDTHEDNKVMQHVILQNGFEERGIIYLSNGDPRIAYEKIVG